ncbi:MAG: Spy/CpxP family protein refolding chaperone, partial [Gemmatimonadota bacterium]|nr:Spy/CpxP family protein refolding chaperone [Gemmatimonadota bacterium]
GMGRGSQGGGGIELVLRLRERLELTEEQIAQLEELRQEGVEHRIRRFQETEDIRSKMQAGLLSDDEREVLREERREEMEALREQREAHREAIGVILTEEQKEQLGNLRQRAMRRGGRGQMRGGRGPRMMDRGFQRGNRGRGFDPRRGIHRFPEDHN